MKRSLLTFFVMSLTAAAASAATFGAAEVYQRQAPIDPDGTLVVMNPFGDVEVIGVDSSNEVSFTVRKSITGVDDVAIREGREQTALLIGGDSKSRLIKTDTPVVHDVRWSCGVEYTIRVPRTVKVRIESHSSQRLRVANITNAVWVKNVNGAIDLENISGVVFADSANGNVTFESASRPTSEI